MKILLIDNYDSFVYNIVGLLQRCQHDFPRLQWDVIRNDEVNVSHADSYDAVILSPGPGIPKEAGELLPLIGHAANRLPILGICLGCQAIAEHFGCRLRRLAEPRHGHPSHLHDVDEADPIVGFNAAAESTPAMRGNHPFEIIPSIEDNHTTGCKRTIGDNHAIGDNQEKSGIVGRYHSWVIDEDSLTESVPLLITSRDEEGNIMSIRHRYLPIFGLQFHPESIITTDGLRMLSNFLRIATAQKNRN